MDLYHAPRPTFSFRTVQCTGVVGGVRDVHGVEMWRGGGGGGGGGHCRSTFVGLGQIVDGARDAHGADRRVGVSVGIPPPHLAVLLVTHVGENRHPHAHARATGAENS